VARTRAAVALERGDLSVAVRHALTTIASIQELHDPYQAMRVLLLLERMLHRLGRHAAAARVSGTIQAVHADGILALPDELHRHRETLENLQAELGPAEFDECATHGRALSIHRALERVASELVSSCAHQPDDLQPPPPAVEHSPNLQVFALGGLRIVQEGTRSGITLTHAKPKELLAFLLCHPQGLTREQIALAFWPDASSTQAKNSFHVLLHKLRKGIGRHDLITASDDRYRVRTDAGVWFDAVEFEREIGSAMKATPVERPRLEAALALYQGDFLDGVSAGDWYLDIQDRLRTLYLNGLSALADLQLHNGEHAAAITTLERLLRKDELREDACRRLMSCLAASGRREQALLVFEKFAARLRDELAAKPEPATVTLARRLATVTPE
ncbi:MAG TPA: BTAD domain-containing putative transcriptional regulator, partial [Steroidobacteraceae bacterium]|nr:BTAD domain-containing putative transcriptional regulator [Steroidobacteraceae bacterium]